MRHMWMVETITDRNDIHDGWLTCFEHSRGVGGAGAVIWDGCDVDLVLLATFQHADLAAGGSWGAVKGRISSVDSRGSVHVSPKHQIPGYCHCAAGAAVVHGHGGHGVYSWKEVQEKTDTETPPKKKCFNLRCTLYSMSCAVLWLTRCGVGNIIGFPRNQEDVDWRYTNGIGGAGLQISDIHGCSWSVSDDRGFPGVAVGHGHLVEQDFTYSIPCHSGCAPSCRYKVHPSWGLYHFNRKYRRFLFFFLNSWQQW